MVYDMNKVRYEIINIPSYPMNGKHLELMFNLWLPFQVFKGADVFHPKNKKGERFRTNKHHWYVEFRERSFLDLPEYVQGFTSPEKALAFAIKSYKAALTNRLQVIGEEPEEYKDEQS